jgi:hypothetical protein
VGVFGLGKSGGDDTDQGDKGGADQHDEGSPEKVNNALN